MVKMSVCGHTSIRNIVGFVFILLLLTTYLLDWWAIHLKRQHKDGNKGFEVVASVNWYWKGKESKHLARNSFRNVSFSEVHETLATHSPFLTGQNESKQMVVTSTEKKLKPVISVSSKPSRHYINFSDAIPSRNIGNNIPRVHVPHVNCKSLSEGDQSEMIKAVNYQKAHHKTLTYNSQDLMHLASNCSNFTSTRQYTMTPLSQEEAEFPLAYSILMYRDVEQVERLLRAIYRPQNYYCIHIDLQKGIWKVMRAIVGCFGNVFIASTSVNVQWGTFSVIEPELLCMKALWKYRWKYFINLTGQEFPLKTNWDIVKILKSFKGANNVDGSSKRLNTDRLRYVHKGYSSDYTKRKQPAPLNVTYTKGSLHIAAQRGFVDYVLHDKDALAFREWVKDTGFPDETFFSSLNYSPQLNVPGSYKGEPETDSIDAKHPRNPFVTRFKNWGSGHFNWTCSGKRIRMICIFGVGDLQMLINRKELFANKFHMDYHPLVYDCLEEFHFNRTRDEVLGKRTFDESFYAKLDFVHNHVT